MSLILRFYVVGLLELPYIPRLAVSAQDQTAEVEHQPINSS